MVTHPMAAIWIAVAATVVCAWAEWLHARRIRRVAYLAFGPDGRAASWTRAVGLMRTVSVGALVWGLVALWQLDGGGRAAEKRTAPADDDLAHLVVALDVSPSMEITDAGPTTADTRATRARDVLRSMLERIDLRRVRVSIIPFFSKARPVVIDTFDPEVVANILADLPLEQAFSSGKTNMYAAVEEAGKIGAKWPANSATLVLVSDGDTLPPEKPLPPAAAFGDVLIVGVGDAHRGRYIDGHVSRQDAVSLEQLALRLDGDYFDANTRQIPTSRVARLAVVGPREQRRPWDNREAAVVAVLVGASCLALVGPALALLGGAWSPARSRPHIGYTLHAPGAEGSGS